MDTLTIDGVLTGKQVMAEIKDLVGPETPVLISFSCGKDSIACWLEMKKYFKKIIPFYLYLIPDLGFVERSLTYYEKYFECRIIRLPHPSLYRMLNRFVFQAPENCEIIERCDLPEFDYEDIRKVVCEDLGLDLENSWYASGVRAADSLNRRTAMKKYGPINRKKHCFYPIWDWKKKKLVREIVSAKIKVPVDYRLFGRSFDGIDYRFLKPIKDHFPEDYKKILEYFPLAELELMRAMI